MEKPKKTGLMGFGKHLTSIVSVGLVLFLLGLVGLLGSAARNITDTIKENMGFNIVISDQATEPEINALKQRFTSAPYVSSYEYLSPEQILSKEEEFVGADIVEALGVNPYPPEINVCVKAQYASTDSIDAIIASLRDVSIIDVIEQPREVVEQVNSNLATVSIVFLGIAIALLIVSFVLINNTVRLTIYSRRFLLHTMQLVGATAGFIRRPIVVGNMLNGLISAAIAIAMLCLLRTYIPDLIPDMDVTLPWSDMIGVFVGVIVGGMLICGLAAYFATNKYLRQNYDDLF